MRGITSVEEIPDDPIPAVLPHASTEPCNTHAWQHDDMAGDPELLDIIGALRGTAVVDDHEESFESESEDDDEAEAIPEIQDISALELFSFTLQRAHDLALIAEREREKGRRG